MITYQQKTFDYCINRARGNRNSKNANPTDAYKNTQKSQILAYIESRTTWGATSAEIEEHFGWAKNKFSGRLTQLLSDGSTFNGGTRSGCAVYVSSKFGGKQ